MAIWPLLIIVPFLVLLYLYARVHVKNPAKRAAFVTALIGGTFIIEFFAGAALIVTGAGGIVYLLMVPVVVGWITVWYHRHIGREVDDEIIPAVTAAYPPQTPVQYHAQTPNEPNQPTKPPQQNPPAASAQ